ncbi:type II toxin-antitoxin system Phd/YefM family antitoxin [Sulfitobacter sp. KE37]|nr:type II toxin-antitoxin system Phd/YefM family antitoxin [Sulfitobacter sp. KE12]MDF3355816.1 type II toxin-antitoxin system Phd/YefM family antitoxin [Sulfitobacter sp. KE27]MDF3370482.1 type II toxin-antitoxin system Phd/YefM family antitoxin [Sulfitobacter sp. Ks43]MDF3374136.1 type II toxin-antitoxin system Phd/YefM family antitoxin [Sulfitobacter sp. KS8]MDF3377782.1 type II toxin-antitoxin system Phd/YefM family antitoxin [Sulfitobacter sp. KE37]MDF3409367.1 type II toxin-antitoxin sy
MGMTAITSRTFNQDASGAKRAAQDGPVFIIDRGKPAHVLLSIEAYRRLAGRQESILDLLADPEAADVAFEPDRLGSFTRPADLS